MIAFGKDDSLRKWDDCPSEMALRNWMMGEGKFGTKEL